MRCLLTILLTTVFFGIATGQSQKNLLIAGGYYLDFAITPPALDSLPVPYREGAIFSDNHQLKIYAVYENSVPLGAWLFIKNTLHDSVTKVRHASFTGTGMQLPIVATKDPEKVNLIVPFDEGTSRPSGINLANVNIKTGEVKLDTLVKDNLRFSGDNYLLFYNGPGSYWYVNQGFYYSHHNDTNGYFYAFLFEDDKLKKTVITKFPFVLGDYNATGLSGKIVGIENHPLRADSVYLHQFEFDNKTGQIHWQRKFGTYKNGLVANGDSIRHYYHSLQLSPNDSFAYLTYVNRRIFYDPVSGRIKNEYFRRFLQVPLFKQNFEPYVIKNTFFDWPVNTIGYLSLGDDGKIYLTGLAYTEKSGDIPFIYVGAIENPDKAGAECRLRELTEIPCREFEVNVFGQQRITCKHMIFFLQKNFLHHRLNMYTRLTCDSLFLTSEGDSVFAEFKWYVTTPAGAIDSSTQQNHALKLAGYGKYAVKLWAKTTNGYYTWRTDSVFVPRPPAITVKAAEKEVCRYAGLNAKIIVDVDSALYDTVRVTCGNWFDTTLTAPLPDSFTITLQAPDTGMYVIKADYTNGTCQATASDTFYVKPTPVAGFALSATEGCVPATVTVTDQSKHAQQWFYYVNGSLVSTTASPAITINTEGNYIIKQVLVSSAGCEAADSAGFTAFPGISATEEIALLRVTCTDNGQVLLEWEPISAAIAYEVIKNGNTKATVTATSYTDADVDVNNSSYRYAVSAADTCGTKTKEGIYSHTILLQGEAFENDYAELEWTGYIGWQAVAEYDVEVMDSLGQWHKVTSLASVNGYTDMDFFDAPAEQKCYRIMAHEAGGNNQHSYSNKLCLPFKPVIFVPNVFTPNSDDVNEYWRPVTAGMAEVDITVYSRWGELIWQGNKNNTGWDGTKNGIPAPQGVYVYQVFYIGTRGERGSRQGTITLMR